MASETSWVPATFTDDEFERLLGETALDRMGRFELRGGELSRMNAQYAAHLYYKMQLYRRIERAIEASGLELRVGVEGTIKFGAGFSPLPDILVYQPFRARQAIPGERVRWIVEVSDSTLSDDLGDKLQEYARAGLPEYWVADINARAIHLFADPFEGAYRKAALAQFEERVAALTLEGVLVEATNLD